MIFSLCEVLVDHCSEKNGKGRDRPHLIIVVLPIGLNGSESGPQHVPASIEPETSQAIWSPRRRFTGPIAPARGAYGSGKAMTEEGGHASLEINGRSC
jgi:hypothetical protein